MQARPVIRPMSSRVRILLIGSVLVATTLRFHGLFANTFHADEALFASWARLIAVWRDPLLQSQLVDKPPLLFYLQAMFYPVLGPVEWAARMPNFIASLLLVPVSGILAWRMFADEMTSILAAAFIAFSPMAIQFSATAFTDPLLTFFMTAVLAAVAGVVLTSNRQTAPEAAQNDAQTIPKVNARLLVWPCIVAGTLFGLATATKYQTWIFLPLIIGLGVFNGWKWKEWRSWILGLLPWIMVTIVWDVVQDGSISLLERQLTTFGGLRMAWSWELWPRLAAWGQQWSYLLASPVLIFALVLSLPLFLALLISEHNRQSALDQLLVVFLIAYFALHWFVAVPVWDRYILPVLPLVGIVLGRYVSRIFSYALPMIPSLEAYRTIFRRIIWLVPLVLLLFQMPAILKAYAGELPVGGQPSADDGASIIAAELAGEPYGTVLYDHWYSWQWRYHLFDQPVYVSWFPHPENLEQDLAAFGKVSGPRYIALPNSSIAEPVIRAVTEHGFNLRAARSVYLDDGGPGMTLYRITWD